MTESEWFGSEDPAVLIDHLGYRLTDRQARLFAVECCWRVWPAFADDRTRRLVLLAERYAWGDATREERLAAEVEAYYLYADATPNGPFAFSQGVMPPPTFFPALAAALAVSERPVNTYLYVTDPDNPLSAERAAQSAILRDLVAWPGRPVIVNPDWLTATVRELARAVQEDGDFDALPILGDALEDAGCAEGHLLNHCRDPRLTHVTGCWLVAELRESR